MYRMLIVDDEALFVRGLSESIQSYSELTLEICEAYSAMEALEILKQLRIDIVLTDIHMPIMSGLEMQKKIHQYWPRCKVIFLTGYDSFQYAKEAIRNGGTDYVLKVEGDQAVFEVIRKAVDQLDKELASESFMIKAYDMIHQARRTLQRECLIDLLEVGVSDCIVLKNSFNELQIPLDNDKSILMVIGQVDQWDDHLSSSDRALFTYAIHNIAEELLQPLVTSFSVDMARTRMIWFIQTTLDQGEGNNQPNVYVQGTFETIQDKCRKLLGLGISFAIANSFVPWKDADRQFEALQHLLRRHVGLEREVLLVQVSMPKDDSNFEKNSRNIRKYIDQLRVCLENNQLEEYNKKYAQLIVETEAGTEVNEWSRRETFMALSTLFLSSIQQWDMKEKLQSQVDLSLLISYDRFQSWTEVATYFGTLANHVLQNRFLYWEQQGYNLVRRLQDYIRDYVGRDLSLTRLGLLVNHNPSYLSRLYKQLTGIGLSETIADARIEKAKTLLKDPKLKIYEVGKAVGFESSQYFRMFFRKATKMTPQEYRELNYD